MEGGGRWKAPPAWCLTCSRDSTRLLARHREHNPNTCARMHAKPREHLAAPLDEAMQAGHGLQQAIGLGAFGQVSLQQAPTHATQRVLGPRQEPGDVAGADQGRELRVPGTARGDCGISGGARGTGTQGNQRPCSRTVQDLACAHRNRPRSHSQAPCQQQPPQGEGKQEPAPQVTCPLQTPTCWIQRWKCGAEGEQHSTMCSRVRMQCRMKASKFSGVLATSDGAGHRGRRGTVTNMARTG